MRRPALFACLFLICLPSLTLGQVRLGIDALVERGFPGLQGKSVGLVVNQASVDSGGMLTVSLLKNAPGVHVSALFAPEHGVDGKTPAGEYVDSHRDPQTGIWVHSLYGKTRKPTPQMLKGLDVIIYDLQDIGVRSYTFISTLGLVMQAAAEADIEVWVLDRPNPLGGLRMEGGGVDPACRSFVGQYDIPYVYGLTAAEMARWINRYWLQKPCRLRIFKMSGWERRMTWDETGLRWVATSPNIPVVGAAFGYAATGLLGDIGITNGAKVTDRPFGWIAAERVDGKELARVLNDGSLPGIRFVPGNFHPSAGKFMQVEFSGVKVEINPKAKADLYSVNYRALDALRKLYPQRDFFARATPEGLAMFDKINGGPWNRQMWQKRKDAAYLEKKWDAFVEKWRKQAEPLFLYQ